MACRVMRMIDSVTLYYIKVNGISCGILKVFFGDSHFVGTVIGGTLVALILNDKDERVSNQHCAASRLYSNRYSTTNMASQSS